MEGLRGGEGKGRGGLTSFIKGSGALTSGLSPPGEGNPHPRLALGAVSRSSLLCGSGFELTERGS